MPLKDFIPPIFIKLLKRVIKKNNEKIFTDYNDAVIHSSANSYENQELCEVIAAKTAVYKKAKNELIQVGSFMAFFLACFYHIYFTLAKKKLVIIDFGGACGAHYLEIKRIIPADIKLKWLVIETPHMVSEAKKQHLETEELKFIDNLDLIDNYESDIDLVYSSCAIHYTSNPYLFLEKLIKLKAAFVLFNRMPFNPGDKDLITLQKSFLSANGPGPLPDGYQDKTLIYPHHTLSYTRFKNYFNDQYQLLWELENNQGLIQVKNIDLIGRGLFYSKI